MKGRKTLSTIIILLVGVVIGIAISLSIGAILSYVDPGTLLTDHPRKFGDVKIFAERTVCDEGREGQNICKTLVMTKNNIPFLVMNQNEHGKVDGLVLLNEKKEAVLSMKPLSAPGNLGQVMYGKSNEAGNLVGDVFVDIDFDGRFDVKHIMDENGKRISASIFIDGSWEKIDRLNVNDMEAALGQTKYVYDSNSG